MMGVVWFISILLLNVIAEVMVLETCEKQTNCGECIRNPAICVWCATEDFHGSRCMSADSYLKDPTRCPDPPQNPDNKINTAKDNEFRSDLTKDTFTQIRPQQYVMDLRTRMPINFTFSYQPATDYPVDLYFLLDTSTTMENVKNIIEQQSKVIFDTMQSLTKNVQLGIGAFIDKNTLPFTDKIDKEKTYSFRNRLKLTKDSDLFKKKIKETEFGSNYDEPEGGLDALAQVLKCKDVIGWRKESRKIVVFLTDATYHVAGDGIIGGIFNPYDGECYTYEEGYYTNELKMDYPSVSIINKLADKEEITVIFVVKNSVSNVYSHLSQGISGSQCVSYDNGNDNIANILTEKYKDITRQLKLKANFEPGFRDKFNIKFDPDCTGKEENPQCGVKEGQAINITGTLEVLKDYGTDRTSVEIFIEGINEKLTLDVGFLRHCECENKAQTNSAKCNNGGTFKCGICECDKDRYGDKCACVANKLSRSNDSSTCIKPGSSDLCQGHGSCICGKCFCNSLYNGPYCQFNKDNCPRHNNTVCNGRGVCENERCACTDAAWDGDACECLKSDSACLVNGKICNNMGTCQCGKCACAPTADWDARDNRDAFCAVLPCRDCHKPQCARLHACALCLHSNENCPECLPFKASVSNYLVSSWNVSWNVCPDFKVDVGCYSRFMYRYSEDEYTIELVVHGDKDCLESYYVFGGTFLGSLILVGVLTLVAWKCLTSVRDRREYERFLKEHAEDMSQVCENPTYRPASTYIANPAFRKPSVDLRN